MATENRNNTGKTNRDARGRFLKGNRSGGRPPLPKAFKELAQEKSPEALLRVIGILNDPAAKPSDVIQAARLIIEYGYGKPVQDVRADIAQQMAGDFVLEIAGLNDGDD